MHIESGNRPAEDIALDRAMTSIDPLLRASLQREQKRRRTRWFLGGGIVVTIFATLVILFSVLLPVGDDTVSNTTTAGTTDGDEIANAERAAELSKEGMKLWQTGKAAQAEEKFVVATKLDPQDANTWNGLGWSRMQQQDFENAFTAFEESLAVDRKHAGALNGAGQAKLFLHEFKQAESYFKKAGSSSPAALYGLARIQLLQGEFVQAERTLGRLAQAGAGELDKQHLSAMLQAAKSKEVPADLKALLEPPALANSAKKAAEESVTATEALKLNSQGWQLFNSGQNHPAELAFRKALTGAPDLAAAKNGLGFCLLNQNKPTESQPIFAELVKEDPTHAGFVNGLARSYELQGELEKAVATWRTVEKDHSPVTACTYGLARTLMQLEQYAAALEQWQRIEKEQPNDETVKQMIKKCLDKNG